MQSIYPRNEGSAQEKKVFELITQRLGELRIHYDMHNFRRSERNHSFSQYIEATLPGEKKDTIIICVPVNNRPQAEREMAGSINIALGLAFLKYAHSIPLPVTVKVLFLGAEYGNEDYYPMGSRLFLNSFFPEYNALVLYLNFEKVPKKVVIKSGANGIVAPYWLINKCAEVFRTSGVQFTIKGSQNQAFRTGLSDEKTIISPYLTAGYPALSFTGEYAKMTENEVSEWILSFVLSLQDFLPSVKQGIPGLQEWDYHYLFFQVFNFYFILSEKILIIIIIAVISIMILYAFFRTKKLKKYLITLKNNVWSIPVFFGLVFIILIISTFCLDILLVVRSFPDLWMSIPAVFFVTKIILCLLFSTFGYMVLKKYKFSKNGSFYTIAALLFLIVTVFIVALINISFTYYFLWALFFIFLFSITRKKYLKIMFLLVSQFWIIIAVIDFLTLPELQICKALIFSPVIGNLFFTIIIIPFILLLIRIRFLFRYSGTKRRPGMSIILGSNLLFVICILTGYILLYDPFNTNNPQVITAERLIDPLHKKNSLLISSRAPLGKLQLLYNKRKYIIDTSARQEKITFNDYPEYFSSALQSVGFLNRKNVTLSLESKGNPLRISVRVGSGDQFVLYDSNFPYYRAQSGKEYTVSIGKNPPNPLKLELTLPKNRQFTVNVTIEYDKPPVSLSLQGNSVILKPYMTLNKSIDINT